MNRIVSIILPIYNSAHTLNRCLDSILSQTYSMYEVVCVNDASTDDSLSILHDYKRKDERIKVYCHNQNKNAGGARNTALSYAIGEYVYFMDSDDYLKPNALEMLVAKTKEFSIDIVCSPLTVVNDYNILSIEDTAPANLSLEEYKIYCLRDGLRMPGGLVKKSLFAAHNITYPENVYFEDNAIGGLLFLYASSIIMIEESGYYYDISNQYSSSRGINEKKVRDRIYTTDLIIKNMKQHGFYDSYKDLIDYRYLSLSVTTIEFISELPWKVARQLGKDVSEKIKLLLPNVFLMDLDEESKTKLMNPMMYLKHQLMLRFFRNSKSYVHAIRHKIVVYVKKLVGMDPTKSIYALKNGSKNE